MGSYTSVNGLTYKNQVRSAGILVISHSNHQPCWTRLEASYVSSPYIPFVLDPSICAGLKAVRKVENKVRSGFSPSLATFHSVFLSVAVIKHTDHKQCGGKGVCFSLQLQVPVITEGRERWTFFLCHTALCAHFTGKTYTGTTVEAVCQMDSFTDFPVVSWPHA